MIAQFLGLPVAVRHVAVEHQRGGLGGHPTDEGIYVGVAALAIVGVGAVVLVVGVDKLVALNLVADVVVAEAGVEHQLGREEVVGQRHVVRLRHGERWIAIGQRCGDAAVDVWVELADAGSRDAHGVGESEIGSRRDVVTHAARRHEVAIVLVEVTLAVLGILHALEGVLVAQTQAGVVFLLGQFVLRVTGHDALQVAVEHAVIGIEYVLTVNDIIESAVALVASADELRACLQRLPFAKVKCQVGLTRVACAPGTRIGVEIAQSEPHHAGHIIVRGTRAVAGRVVVEEIAQRQL